MNDVVPMRPGGEGDYVDGMCTCVVSVLPGIRETEDSVFTSRNDVPDHCHAQLSRTIGCGRPDVDLIRKTMPPAKNFDDFAADSSSKQFRGTTDPKRVH